MDRIRATFEGLRQARRKGLIPFIMAGDPDLETTSELLHVLADAGADLIEVGLPFSDPLADGPIIQRASHRALTHGATPPRILAMLGRLSQRVRVPVLILSYWNPILQYGRGPGRTADPAHFLRAASTSRVAGVIVPDLPPEEAHGFRGAAAECGVATIFLASPTSPPGRLRQIARAAEGFVYYVSVTGTTGVRKRLPLEWLRGVRQLKRLTTKPICVGFGISTPAHAATVAGAADGVIIGSALLQALEPVQGNRRRLLRRALTFLQPFRRIL